MPSLVERFDEHAAAFEETFGCSLKLFFNSATGFDVVGFDEKVVKPDDGVSCAQAIEERWGKEAVALIRTLIGPSDYDVPS